MSIIILLHCTVLLLIFDYGCSVIVNSNVFSVSHLPAAGFNTNVGNGYISFDVGCPTEDISSSAGSMFVAGVYTGKDTSTPSHRALIPQNHAFFVDGVLLNGIAVSTLSHSWNASLNIEKGIFSNISTFSLATPGFIDSEVQSVVMCEIEMSWYVHREVKDMSVLHIVTRGQAGTDCIFKINSCNSIPRESVDVKLVDSFNMTSKAAAVGTFTVNTYETLEAETQDPSSGLTTVRVVSTDVPSMISGDTEFTSFMWVQTFLSDADSAVVDSVTPSIQFENAALSLMPYHQCAERHAAAWGALWTAGIEIEGNSTVAAAVNASLYYILSSVDATILWSTSPGGLAKNSYSGHVFWDCETWMLPALVPFYPDIVFSLEQYRAEATRLAAAQARATAEGLPGAKLPWESGFTGVDVTPDGNEEGDSEIHITADVPLAMRLLSYWMHVGTSVNASYWTDVPDQWTVVEQCCRYLAARAVCVDEECSAYTYLGVIPPDESAGVVDSSVYTNAVASDLLGWAASVGMELGLISVDTAAHWSAVASAMYIPLSSDLCDSSICGPTTYMTSHKIKDELQTLVHSEYSGYNGQAINQADAVLLQFPLQFPMDDQLAYNDLQYYASRTSVPGESSREFYTGDSSYAIAYLNLLRRGFVDKAHGGDLLALAAAQFQLAFDHMDSTGFNIWTETPTGGHYNFITGAGGFLQNVIYGYGGVSITQDSLSIDPILAPGGVTSMTFRGMMYKQSSFSVNWNEENLMLKLLKGCISVQLEDNAVSGDKELCASRDDKIIFPLGKITITKKI